MGLRRVMMKILITVMMMEEGEEPKVVFTLCLDITINSPGARSHVIKEEEFKPGQNLVKTSDGKNMAGTSGLAIFPGAGNVLRDRTNVTISSMSTFRTIKYYYDVTGEINFTGDNLTNEIEIVDIPNGGRQCTMNLTVLVEWSQGGTAKRPRCVDKVVVYPAEICTGTTKIKVLLLEVVKDVKREDVLHTVNSEEVKKWLSMCDNALLETDNWTRKLFKDLSRSTENLISEVLGPTSLNRERHPCTLNLAKLCVEQVQSVAKETVVMLFNTYDTNTVRILAKVDSDTKLMLIICTMTAWKYAMHANSEWTHLFMIEDAVVSWPRIMIDRK